MIIITAPGQGSQKPGFLTPWLDLPGAKDTLESWSYAISVDLIGHGTLSDHDTIRDTSVAQPLIVAAGLLTGRLVQQALGDRSDISYAGHSVGEFTAAALAGVLSDEDALALVAIRGRAMADAAALSPTGMAAVIGGDYDDVARDVESRGLVPANVNGGGQVVAAGPTDALADLLATPPAGTRVIPLDVAGAFHTHFMESAVTTLGEAANGIDFHTPTAPLYTNRDGSKVSDGDTFRTLLIGQVSSPVRWDMCMESFVADGAEHLIELAPAGALAGLAKRAMKGVETWKIDLPEHVESLMS